MKQIAVRVIIEEITKELSSASLNDVVLTSAELHVLKKE
jgi:hypothetical protein